jgi:hypothetical protein
MQNNLHPNGMPACSGIVVAYPDLPLASLQDALLLGRIPVVSLRSTTG